MENTTLTANFSMEYTNATTIFSTSTALPIASNVITPSANIVSSSSNVAFEEGVANFSFSLYGTLERQGNEFISPYSIFAALALLTLGTDGTTRNQLLNSMFRAELPLDIDQGYQTLEEKIYNKTGNGVQMSIANKIFLSETFKLLDSYKENALEYYDSNVEPVNFATQAELTRRKINNWIANQTQDKIQDMIPLGIIRTDTIMVLANAIYFKGTWKTQFDRKLTTKRNFYVSQNNQRQVSMMYGQFEAASGENTELNCKILQLPYTGNELSMILLLPNDGNGLSQLESRLTLSKFKEIVSGLTNQETLIRIPTFIVEAEYDLQPILANLGIIEIFDSTVANFSRMVSDNGVFVSDARHKAFFEVNEEGTEAAAATTITMTKSAAKSAPFEFVADRPFMFVILDQDTGTVVFIGRYADP